MRMWPVLLTAGALAVSCGACGAASAGTSPAAKASIVGRWQQTHKCTWLVHGLRQAHLRPIAPAMVGDSFPNRSPATTGSQAPRLSGCDTATPLALLHQRWRLRVGQPTRPTGRRRALITRYQWPHGQDRQRQVPLSDHRRGPGPRAATRDHEPDEARGAREPTRVQRRRVVRSCRLSRPHLEASLLRALVLTGDDRHDAEGLAGSRSAPAPVAESARGRDFLGGGSRPTVALRRAKTTCRRDTARAM